MQQEHYIISVILLPETRNSDVAMRKHQMNSETDELRSKAMLPNNGLQSAKGRDPPAAKVRVQLIGDEMSGGGGGRPGEE